ncbi:MAG: DUF434 domain-containing protein [Myxococcales bacterium]|nr:DUF434 domain-containing protein [Myxococcales bacterium]
MSSFEGEALERLKLAAEEMAFLVGRGYAPLVVQSLVSAHRRVTPHENAVLARAVLSEAQYRQRALKEMLPEDIAKRPLVIDAHDVIDAVAAALAGKVVIETLDQTLSPLEPFEPTEAEVDAALSRLFTALREMRPSKTKWILSAARDDAPRTASRIHELAKKAKVVAETELSADAKATLKSQPNVATSDADVIAACKSWCNLGQPALMDLRDIAKLKLQ